jgi:formylglycine-generating enzyme required for sulfatase activity
LRGGSYRAYPWELRVTNRFSAEPYEKGNYIGFRTAYTEF